MNLPMAPSRGRNWESPPWCYLLWGVPAVIIFGAGAAYGSGILSPTTLGILNTLSVAWIGTGCLLNGRSCGRVHCKIDGVLFPILAIVGALKVLSVLSFSWNLFWLVFFIILVAGFIPEWTWKRYM